MICVLPIRHQRCRFPGSAGSKGSSSEEEHRGGSGAEQGGGAGRRREAEPGRSARGPATGRPASAGPRTVPCWHRRGPAPTHVFRYCFSTNRQACVGRRASVTPASGKPSPRALERRVAPLHAACHPGLPSTTPRPGPTSLSETQQPGSIPFFFPPEERGRLDGSPTVPTPQRPPPAPLPVAGSNHGGRENGTTPPRPPTPHGRSGGPSPLLPSQSLERGGPGHS